MEHPSRGPSNASSIIRTDPTYATASDNDDVMTLKPKGSNDTADTASSSPPPDDDLSMYFTTQKSSSESDPPPPMVTQPSPPSPTSGKCSVQSAVASDECAIGIETTTSPSPYGQYTTTPSRRSRRVRTPSTKKKESLESQRSFVTSRKKTPRKSAKKPTKAAAADSIDCITDNNIPPDHVTKSTIDSGFKATSSHARKVSSPIRSPSPSVELLNVDLLDTPSRSAWKGLTTSLDEGGDDASDGFSWSASKTPDTYFGDSPLVAGTPPPRRNARVRTPFCKARCSSITDATDSPSVEIRSARVDELVTFRNQSTLKSAPQIIDSHLQSSQSSMKSVPTSVTTKTNHGSATGTPQNLPLSSSPTSIPALTVAEPTIQVAATPTGKKRKASTDSGSLRRSSRRASLTSPYSSQSPMIYSKQASSTLRNNGLTIDTFRGMSPMVASACSSKPPIPPKSTMETPPVRSTIEYDTDNSQRKRRSSRRATLSIVVGDSRQSPALSVDLDSSGNNKRGSTRRTSLSTLLSSESPSERTSSLDTEDSRLSKNQTSLRSGISLAEDSPSKSIGRKRSGSSARRSSLAPGESPSVSLDSSSGKVGQDDKQSKKRRAARRATLSSGSIFSAPEKRKEATNEVSTVSRGSSNSIMLDDDKPAKKRRGSRRATMSALTAPKLKQSGDARNAMATYKGKGALPPLPPSAPGPSDNMKPPSASTIDTSLAPIALRPSESTKHLPPLPPSTPELSDNMKPTSSASTTDTTLAPIALAPSESAKEENVAAMATEKVALPPRPPSASSGPVVERSSAKASRRLSTFKLPPLPSASLSTTKRNSRRRSLASGSPSSLEWVVASPTLPRDSPAAPTSTPRRSPRHSLSSGSRRASLGGQKPAGGELDASKSTESVLVTLSESKGTTIQAPSPDNSADAVKMHEFKQTTIEPPPPKAGLKEVIPQVLQPKEMYSTVSGNKERQSPMPRRSPRKKTCPSPSTSLGKASASLVTTKSHISSINRSGSKKRLLTVSATTPIKAPSLENSKSHAIDSFPAETISKKACRMFANGKIAREACLSARIFACFDLSQPSVSSNVADIPAKKAQSGITAPLMQLLISIVRLEMTSLEERDSGKVSSRKVQFSGFDCSSTKPPIDSKAGSHSHQEDCIAVLVLASQQIQSMANGHLRDGAGKVYEHSSLEVSLQSMVRFLDAMLVDTQTTAACAKSIDTSYPPRRFNKAIEMYKNDFENILQRLMGFQSVPSLEATTFLERRLAEFSGQAIRFHLRKLFNPPPLPFTRPSSQGPPKETVPNPNHQSSVFELVELEIPGSTRDSAVADGSVSSLFSMALRRIYDYFGVEAFRAAISSDDSMIPLPHCFCTSPASQRGLGNKKNPAKFMPPEELDELTGEIDDVFNFLAAYRGCKFLVELVRSPGVAEEVENMGGWSTIEKHAKTMMDHNLYTVYEEDAHFSAIAYAGNMEHLFRKIEDWLSHMEPKSILAEISIKAMAKRFKATKTTSPKQRNAIYRKFPHVKVIAEAIEDGQTRSSSFPCVKPVALSQ